MKILIKIYNWIIKMAKKVLNLDTNTGAESWGSADADNVVLDTTNFDKNLDTTITDVQKLADAVDDLDLGGTQIQTDWNQSDNTQVDYIKNKPELPNLYLEDELAFTYYRSGYDKNIQTSKFVYTSIGPGTPFQVINNSDKSIVETARIEKRIKTYGGQNSVGLTVANLNDGNNRVALNIEIADHNYYAGGTAIEIAMPGINTWDGYILKYIDYLNQGIIIKSNGEITTPILGGTGTRPLVALEDGTIAVGEGSGRNYIEFLSNPLAAVSDAYAFSNTRLGLDGVNLNKKIKMAQCYVIQADYPNVKNNELVMGHNIEDGQISVRLNFNLAIGDRIKIYLEYID